MSHPNDTSISSSSSWIPYAPPVNGAGELEAGRAGPSEDPEPSHFPQNPARSSSSTRPVTPKLTMSGGSFSRPALGRSATTPHLRKRTSTTFARIGSQTPREWSVFGQVMENDGQITPKTPSVRRGIRTQTTRVSSGDTTPRGSMMDSYASLDIRSPVAEEGLFAGRNPADSDSDSESVASSDSDDSSAATVEQEVPQSKWHSLKHRIPSVPILYRNIFKCAVAYFIASLFTFNPYLTGFISDVVSYGSGERKPLPSGHMVATVCVSQLLGHYPSSSLFLEPCILILPRLWVEWLKLTFTASSAWFTQHLYVSPLCRCFGGWMCNQDGNGSPIY